MSDIFISYGRSNAAQAEQIAEALRALGYGVWRDDELPAHRAYVEVIEERLRAAKAVLVIWSAEAVKSQWVFSEANRGRQDGKLVQLTLDDAPLPMPFDAIECADLRGWHGDAHSPGWRKVVASLTELAGGTAAAAGPAPAAPGRRLAVLAFDNLSADPEMSFFSDGISEEILETVARTSDLQVIGRGSSFQFRGADKAARRVAAALQVTHILDGSVRRAGSRVRISAQLVECRTETRVWSERFDRELSDVFALQDEIAAAVAAAVGAAFAPSPSADAIEPAAYDLYLKARDAGSNLDLAERERMLEAAVQIAPGFARAWAQLATTRAQLAVFGRSGRPFEPLQAAAQAARETAVRLDPGAGLAVAAMATLEPFAAFTRREALLNEAFARSPNDPRCLEAIGNFHAQVGRLKESLAFGERALALDPLLPAAMVRCIPLRGLSYAGMQAAYDAIRLRWPHYIDGVLGPAVLAARNGDWPKYGALAAYAGAHEFPNHLEGLLRETLRFCEALRSRDPDYIAQVLKALTAGVDRTGMVRLDAMVVAVAFGQNEAVFAEIERATFPRVFEPGRQDIGGGWNPTIIFHPNVNGALMADPRFVRLCAKLGLVDYWIATDRWPDCADAVAYDFRAEARKVAAFQR